MAGRGRPPIGDRIEVRLPESALAILDARAAAEGTTRAAQIRRLLIVVLAENVSPDDPAHRLT